MNKNMLSAIIVLLFVLAGSLSFILHKAFLWRSFVMVATGVVVVEIIRHWQDIREDVNLLLNAESPHKCRWPGSGLLIFLVLLWAVIELIDAFFALFIR